jgi:hypothetical protein
MQSAIAEGIGLYAVQQVELHKVLEIQNPLTCIMRKALLHNTGNIIADLNPEYFQTLKRENRGVGNTINYAVNLLEGASKQNEIQMRSAEAEVIQNLYTAIIEHPLANAIGVYTYQNKWVEEGGRFRLKGDFGYMDEIIQEGIENKSGQIPEFEIKRNKQDGRVLDILTQERSKGKRATIVKFSPTPPDYNDPEVSARGYQGNDQISFFEIDEQGREVTTIYWFSGVQQREYMQLAKELIAIDPANTELNSQLFKVLQGSADPTGIDVNIMAMSNKFNESQLARIKQFVNEKQQNTKANENEIRYFANVRTRKVIEDSLIHDVYKVALAISKGEYIQPGLDLIYKTIEQLQFELVMYINELSHSGSNEVSVSDYIGMNFQQREELLRKIGYQASGCGFATTAAGSWGNSGVLLKGISGETDKYGSLEFDCPHCGETNHREPGKLMSKCQECHREIPRC